MPSAFAHVFVGAAIARGGPSGASRLRLALVLGALAAAPDLDVVGFWWGVPYGDALGHRGLSHSVPFAALAAPLGAWACGARPREGGARFARVSGLAFLAMASHGLLDTLTDAGLGVGLALPFDGTRYFAPWRPLETSPLSVGAFFGGRGLAILANEALWIGVPTVLATATLAALRRR